MSELDDAVRNGDAARVVALLDEDPSRVHERGGALLTAVYHGKPELAQLFLDRGAQLTFHEACALGDSTRALALLHDDPSLLGQRSADGFPALGLAIFFRHGELARALIALGADVNAAADNAQRVTPLHAAVAVRDIETARLLLERGADVHAKQQMDYTPLHGAASRGDVALAELLLAHGADVDAKASDGMTPADVADKYGQLDFVAWLSAR
ncbi:MAG TPA: ankyrin repeat domain-containing protein [Thermoanaerobaculia bacterium]|nr:ankyrin repeat domain-containing protein [Thermoanaerobaculia bacterium]